MILFNTDLDNTIIYSYKHDIGPEKRMVELYQGREISFISEETFYLLQEARSRLLMVPTTTRSIEQYERIDLGLGAFPYALACNGGILLENGRRNEAWYQDSLKLIAESEEVIKQSISLLETEQRRYFEIRHIEKLFVFTKCREPEAVIEELRRKLDTSLADVFNNGDKIYVVPKSLNKGKALLRLKTLLKADRVLAAGDSEFDISMVEAADLGLVPPGFKAKYGVEKASVKETPEQGLFSEELLKLCLEACAEN